VPFARRGVFYAGLGLLLLAFVSPIDWIGEERLFSVHMAQHLLLGDLGPLLVVLGLTGPLLRPLLALRSVGRLRVLAHPLVALPLWVVNLVVWHLPVLYDGALRHDAVHALQHVCFFTVGALMWAALVEPLPGPAWFGTAGKLAYVVAVSATGIALGNVFVWAGHPFYGPYVHAPRLWAISALSDQVAGGAVMLVEGSLVTLSVLAWLGLRWLRESEQRQRLVEDGMAPEAAARAVRYGRPS
jgi:cytochrome c oxidase assembly factor CtaG